MIKVVHIHIPKTAGTKIKNMIQFGLGDLDGSRSYYPGGYTEELIYKTDVELREYDFVSGHFGFAITKRFDERFMSVTFLRDPLERLISLYYHWKKLFGEKYSDMSIFDFIDCDDQPVVENIVNAQTWQIAYGFDNRSREHLKSLTKSQLLDLALDNLNKIDFVGIKENMRLSINAMCKRLKIPVDHDPEFVIQPEEYNSDGKENIDRNMLLYACKLKLDLDYELYREGKKLLDWRS